LSPETIGFQELYILAVELPDNADTVAAADLVFQLLRQEGVEVAVVKHLEKNENLS